MMNDRCKQLIIMAGIYLAGGLIALVLVLSGFDPSVIRAAKAEKAKAEEPVAEEPAAEEQAAEEPVPETPAPEPEAAPEPVTEAPEPEVTEEPVTEEPVTEEPSPEIKESEPVVEETPALGPEGKPLTVLAETAKDYKSFKTLNREKILHVRIAPDINSEIVARLSPGTEGLVLEVGEHWSRIRSFDGTITGYCSNEYLTFTDITEEEFRKLKKDLK